MVRYLNGDRATYATHTCACGRGLPLPRRWTRRLWRDQAGRSALDDGECASVLAAYGVQSGAQRGPSVGESGLGDTPLLRIAVPVLLSLAGIRLLARVLTAARRPVFTDPRSIKWLVAATVVVNLASALAHELQAHPHCAAQPLAP